MKKVEVLLNPILLDDLKQALTEVGIQEVTASIVKNFGSGNPHIVQYRGIEQGIESLAQVNTQFVVSDADCPRALEAIRVVVRRDGLTMSRLRFFRTRRSFGFERARSRLPWPDPRIPRNFVGRGVPP